MALGPSIIYSMETFIFEESSMKPWFKRGLAGVALALSAMLSHAQSFPDNKPITMVVPFAAGGPTDVVARMIAIPMGKALNTVVTVENTVGAGGTIAATRVARAARSEEHTSELQSH